MEFIKNNAFGAPVWGRYEYLCSSENEEHLVFHNWPTKKLPGSNRWFNGIGFTYSTLRGYCDSVSGDDMDQVFFWENNPDASFRLSRYEWEYLDEACTKSR